MSWRLNSLIALPTGRLVFPFAPTKESGLTHNPEVRDATSRAFLGVAQLLQDPDLELDMQRKAIRAQFFCDPALFASGALYPRSDS